MAMGGERREGGLATHARARRSLPPQLRVVSTAVGDVSTVVRGKGSVSPTRSHLHPSLPVSLPRHRQVIDKDVEGAADMGARILAFNVKVAPAIQKAADKLKVGGRG